MDIAKMDQGLLFAYLVGFVILAGIFVLVYPSLKDQKKDSTTYHKIKR